MKTVLEMACEAGLFTHKEVQPEIERFAELVRADEQKKWQDQTAVETHEAILDEREACAKVCEEQMTKWPFGVREKVCADAIRARSREQK